ncbi:hypothetical protein N7462_003046 [Penicillium macrosclerotiorum]|uniref:uncharacterized protein n=1 Tax=Penicillium macrosclerotiorum TaxID=303699 RepID=UPI0025499A9B|nr:uncharacterized protein N7462_003046 [Penicillium macrosclerotiorum]KAJ5688654.1 hypothetical protein N7462_003046 [Penicillium macrosclerotiorum]
MHLLSWRRDSAGVLRCLILTHHANALAAVRDDLLSASGGPECEGMLCAIVALACYAHLQGDPSCWKQHMLAINRILQHFCLTWDDLTDGKRVDCIGSYAFDIPPTVSHALEDKVPAMNGSPTSAPAAISMRLAGLCPAMWEAFGALEMMNTQIELLYTQQGEELWQRPGEVDAIVHPVTLKFLSLPKYLDASPAWICLRSGALLYLAEFRRRSGISPVATGLHVQQLYAGLKTCGILGPRLRLWLLTVGFIEKSVISEADSLDLLEKTLHEMNIASMTEWKNSLKEIIWLDALFNQKLLPMSGSLMFSPFYLLCDT